MSSALAPFGCLDDSTSAESEYHQAPATPSQLLCISALCPYTSFSTHILVTVAVESHISCRGWGTGGEGGDVKVRVEGRRHAKRRRGAFQVAGSQASAPLWSLKCLCKMNICTHDGLYIFFLISWVWEQDCDYTMRVPTWCESCLCRKIGHLRRLATATTLIKTLNRLDVRRKNTWYLEHKWNPAFFRIKYKNTI